MTSSDQTGTVTGLNPSTDYNCTVSAVMKHSELKSHSITVKTAKAGAQLHVS